MTLELSVLPCLSLPGAFDVDHAVRAHPRDQLFEDGEFELQILDSQTAVRVSEFDGVVIVDMQFRRDSRPLDFVPVFACHYHQPHLCCQPGCVALAAASCVMSSLGSMVVPAESALENRTFSKSVGTVASRWRCE